ncbi:uncharacterized protein zgc:162608 [Esox lucius]|uniref:Uncharacterized protein n=1 Tax=Esox lucius TaxID=8010 RepID=A0A3P9A5C3_ESOLU|nr:uncharacterized protein zgc:162608 [Esox lucius]
MLLKVVIFALSLLMTTAYPLYHTNREASQTQQDLTNNEVHEKTDMSKDVNGIWKSHVKDSPLVSEIGHKLTLESERLHARLRQELTELRERLSLYPVHPGSSESTLARMGERLAALTEQLQSTVNDNSQELCGQLRLHLQELEVAVRQGAAETALYPEAVRGMSQTLDDSSAKTTSVIRDFKTKTSNMIEELKGSDEGVFWQDANIRLEQEAQAFSLEVRGRAGVLKAKLASLLLVPQPIRAEVSTSLEQFCQSAASQDRLFHAKIKKHLLGRELQTQSQSESPTLQPLGLLEEDFSAKLSAVLQDILQTVQ